jgi:hypothetical protein
VIDFAIGADVPEAFRAAVKATAENEWKPLIRMFDGKPQETDQEWAEVCYVPNWEGYSRKRADYRFLAIREPLRQLPLGDRCGCSARGQRQTAAGRASGPRRGGGRAMQEPHIR